MARHESIRYRGIKFYRYPESKYQTHRRYWNPGIGDRQRGADYLHREVWRDANGRQEIPEGYHVHHINHDYDDNRPENLALVSNAEHQEHHMRHHVNDPDWVAQNLAHLERVRGKAAEWHGSEEGRRWHSEHWHNSLAKSFVEREGKCDQCGKGYSTKTPSRTDRFCSNACKSAWRRDSGVDDVQRECAWCGDVFVVNKYVKKATCSRSCTTARNRAKRTV